MTSITEIMQLCRLCLVKEQVNIPIFEEQGDLQQIIEKISACLPVKVLKEDKLPKKICDGCSYKLELLYQFRNTTVTAEKQLLSWINQLGGNKVENEVKLLQPATQHIVKEEVDIVDTADHPDTEYLLGQQITFEGGDTPFLESQDDNGAGDDDITNSSDDEPLAKRRKRLLEDKGQNSAGESKEEVVQHMAVTKTEDASESEGEENVDDPEPNFVSVGTDDIQQPGPSGVGKAATTDIPLSLDTPDPLAVHTSEYNEYYKQSQNIAKSRQGTIKFQIVEYSGPNNTNCQREDADNSIKENLLHDSEENEIIYGCDVCNLEFSNPIKFSFHSREHSELKLYKCALCNFKTANRTSMRAHVKRIHYRAYKIVCEACGKGFFNNPDYADHMAIHAGKKGFLCQYCGKGFAVLRYLQVHQKLNHRDIIEGNDESYQCWICGRLFKFEKSLVRHLSCIHNIGEDRKVPCPVCNKVMANNYGLKLHMRTHTGEKPYGCKFCDNRFANGKYLKKHILKNHPEKVDKRKISIAECKK